MPRRGPTDTTEQSLKEVREPFGRWKEGPADVPSETILAVRRERARRVTMADTQRAQRAQKLDG